VFQCLFVCLFSQENPELFPDFWPSSLPEGVYTGQRFAVCESGGKLYYCGGDTLGRAFLRYDPLSNDWTILPPLPSGRRGHTLAAVGQQIFVIGGLDAILRNPFFFNPVRSVCVCGV
jgi:hypothetical protein